MRTVAGVRRSTRARRVKAPAIIRLPHNEWKPRPHQETWWDYHESGGLRSVAVAHRRFGKDEIALNWMAVAAHKRVGSYWYLLPEQAQGKKAIWEAIDPETGVRRIDQAFPEAIRAATREQEMFIKFTCGSTLQVVGSDNYNSLVGSPPVGCVFSEWPLANPAAWVYLSPILEHNTGWAAFIYTPRGKNHGYSFWRLSQTQPGWFGMRKRADQTGVFTPAQLANIRSELMELYGEEDGENLYEQEYNVSFDVAVIGAYFGKIIARLEAEGRVCPCPHDPSYPVYTAWDLGLDDATAIWFAQIVGREVRIIGYVDYRNKALVEIAGELLRRPYTYADHLWPHDGDTREMTYAKSRKETVEGVGLKGIRIGQPRDDTERINAVRQFLPKCVFDNGRDVTKGLEGLRSFRVDYDEKNRTPRQKPKHDWASHPAHAFAELVMQLPEGGYMARRYTPMAQSYDPLQIHDPAYRRHLERLALADDDDWEQPWRRHHTAGDYDPFSIR